MRLRVRLDEKRVRRMRQYIAENRCQKRPSLIHDWRVEYVVWDSAQLAPPAEEILVCNKCGEEAR